jgi:hypothetical protein
MSPAEAHQVLTRNTPIDLGRFYGATGELSLGAGLIYAGVRCPAYNEEDQLFDTLENIAYVLTHECDVDPANERLFNDYVAVCPVYPVEHFVAEYLEQVPDGEKLRNFLAQVARRLVSRVVYLPPIGESLQYGGLIYLNQIASTHVSQFLSRRPLACVSAHGLEQLDYALTNHLLRPKSERLEFGPLGH